MRILKIFSTVLIPAVLSVLFLHNLAPGSLAADTTMKHGIGVAAGFVSGYGLSYRYLGVDPYIIQLTFSPYVENENVTISSGFALLKNMHTGYRSKLFSYIGMHYLYTSYTEKWDEETEKDIKGSWTDHHFNIGGGPGFEFAITENIVFNLMAGYAVYFLYNQTSILNFTGETALFFYY